MLTTILILTHFHEVKMGMMGLNLDIAIGFDLDICVPQTFDPNRDTNE